MSNDLVFQGGNQALPAHLQQYKDKVAAAAELVTSFNSLPKISIKGKQFRYSQDGKDIVMPAGSKLEVIILASDPPKGCAKSYYNAAFSQDSAEMPDCFSSDGITPDSFVDNPKCRSCAECPLNAFGSGTDAQGNPSKGKACGDHKNLFVVKTDDIGGDIFNIRVPATSLKSLSGFGRLLSKHGVAPQVVVTELGFTDEVHPQLDFNCLRYLDAEEAPASVARSESDELEFALPSKNKEPVTPAKTESVKALENKPEHLGGEPAEPEVPQLPDVPPAEPVLTAKANGATLESFFAKGWTEDLLLEHGYLAYED